MIADPWWWRAPLPIWLLVPYSFRRAHCVKRGSHRPIICDLGRDKRCETCGAR